MTGTMVAGTAAGEGAGDPSQPPDHHGGTPQGPAGAPHPSQRRPGPGSLPRRLRDRLPSASPGRLRLLRALVVALTVGLAALLAFVGLGASGAWDRIDGRATSRVTGAGDLYFALTDMDAQAANLLLSGGLTGTPTGTPTGTLTGTSTDLAPMPAQHAAAQTQYTAARHTVSTDLLVLGAAAQGDPRAEATVIGFNDDFSRYQELIGRALENDAHPATKADSVPDYPTATDLLRQSLLPAAERLGQSNDGDYEATYQGARSDVRVRSVALLVLAVALLGVLLFLQAHLARRFRRLLSPALLAATGCAALALGLGWSVLSAQSHDLKVARRDAFDSVAALSQARALSYDANAYESRYLLDPDRRSTYEQGFEDTSQRLLTLPGASLSSYDARLDTAWASYLADPGAAAGPPFTGFFGDEFRNITFPGERAAAEATVRAYAVYERDDRTMRAMLRKGDFQQAVEFGIGWDKGASNYHFDQYDKALLKLIAINRDAYDASVRDGRGTVRVMLPGAGAALLAAAGLTVLALRPRLAEFR